MPTLEVLDQVATVVRAIGDHGDAPFPRQRQQAIFDLAVGDVVGELHEIDVVFSHDAFGLVVPATVRGGDADVSDLAIGFHVLEYVKVLAPVGEVVDLDQVEAVDAPTAGQVGNLLARAAAGRAPGLLGGVERVRFTQFVECVAHDVGRGAVHQ
jgi:hypothetical protein